MAGWEVFDIDSDEAKVALDVQCEIPVGRSPDSASLENPFRSWWARVGRLMVLWMGPAGSMGGYTLSFTISGSPPPCLCRSLYLV